MKPSTSSDVLIAQDIEIPTSILHRPHLRVVKGRDAMNFCEFPLAALSDRVPDDQKTLVFDDVRKHNGKEVVQRVTVAASQKYGLPTAMDDEVAFGLIQLSHAYNFTQRTIPFTRYDLIRILGWRDDGKSYRRIHESLLRWLSVTLIYEKSWWDNEDDMYVSEGFHVLEHVVVLDRERFDRRRSIGKETLSSFTWNEVVFRSFQAGYLKEINLDIYRSLQSAVAKRLYRFLDKRLYHRGRWELDLHQLCCHKLGMSTRSHTGELKRCLMTGIEELVENGLIRPCSQEERFIKQKAGVWTVVLEEGVGRRSKDSSRESDPMTTKLIERGVRPTMARQLTRDYSTEMIQDRVSYHDWLVARKDKRISKSPAGFLVQSIRGEYPLPNDFPRATPKRLSFKPNSTPQAVNAVPAMTPEDTGFESYWSGLDEVARAEHEAAAIGAAKPFLVETLHRLRAEGSPLIESMRREILTAYLRSRGLLPANAKLSEQGRGK